MPRGAIDAILSLVENVHVVGVVLSVMQIFRTREWWKRNSTLSQISTVIAVFIVMQGSTELTGFAHLVEVLALKAFDISTQEFRMVGMMLVMVLQMEAYHFLDELGYRRSFHDFFIDGLDFSNDVGLNNFLVDDRLNFLNDSFLDVLFNNGWFFNNSMLSRSSFRGGLVMSLELLNFQVSIFA